MKNLFLDFVIKGMGFGLGISIIFFIPNLLSVSISGNFNTFSSGDLLDANKLNQNFNSLKSAIENIPNWTKAGSNNDKAVFQNGYVGIGVANPSNPLEISSMGNNTPLLVRTSGTTNFSGLRIFGESSNAETQIIFDRSDFNIEKWAVGVVPFDQGSYFTIYNRANRVFNVTSNSRIGIMTDNPSQTFTVNGSAGNTTGVWVNNSDLRLKKEIRELESFMNIIKKLRPIKFKWKDHHKLNATSGDHIGFIAQEIELLYPEWVFTDEKGMKWLNMEGFNAVMVKSIQEMDERINKLELKIYSNLSMGSKK